MTTAFALALLLAQQPTAPPPPKFESLLENIAPTEPHTCPSGDVLRDRERDLFWEADEIVAHALNEPSAASPKARAVAALQKLERLSAEVNRSWPNDYRFHFEVIEVPPLLLVRMSLRMRWTFSAFAVSEGDSGDKSQKWRRTYFDEHRGEALGIESLRLFPLDRGPANKPRFLALFVGGSCAGSWAVEYFAYQWDPRESAQLDEIIKVAGAAGMGDERFGKLQTKGPIVTLPYCWFSAIDWWDNPTMCAVDSYNLSGDEVRFVSRIVNHPDLLPIVRAIQYAQARDYPAVRAYCGPPELARRLVSLVPPDMLHGGEEPAIKKTGPTTETIELGGFRFEVEKRGSRWLVVGFRMD